MQRISIIIVEYNSLSDIKKCIKLISSQLGSVEIIVSSNSLYTKEREEEIQEEFTAVKWVFNSKNGGFAYAMNRGIKVSNGDYIVIMNPDVLLHSKLDSMIDYIVSNPTIGAIAPKIVDDNGVVQDSFKKIITPLNFILRHARRVIFRKTINYDYKLEQPQPIDVDWLIGAFIMVRREVYDLIGGLDENYFLYCEDMDWCRRIKEANYRVVYYPNCSINYVGTRSARSSKKYTKIFLQSLFYYWKKFR